MNHIFRIVWNCSLSRWVVTSELGKSHQKKSRASTGLLLFSALLLQTGMAQITDDDADIVVKDGNKDILSTHKVSADKKTGGFVDGTGSELTINGEITHDKNQHVAVVQDGGVVKLGADFKLDTQNKGASSAAFVLKDAKSNILGLEGKDLDVKSQFLKLENGASFILNADSITSSGSGRHSLFHIDDSELTNNAQLSIHRGGVGFTVGNSARIVNNGSIKIDGSGTAFSLSSRGYDIVNHGKIDFGDNGSGTAFEISGSGKIENHGNIHNGSITMKYDGNDGPVTFVNYGDLTGNSGYKISDEMKLNIFQYGKIDTTSTQSFTNTVTSRAVHAYIMGDVTVIGAKENDGRSMFEIFGHNLHIAKNEVGIAPTLTIGGQTQFFFDLYAVEFTLDPDTKLVWADNARDDRVVFNIGNIDQYRASIYADNILLNNYHIENGETYVSAKGSGYYGINEEFRPKLDLTVTDGKIAEISNISFYLQTEKPLEFTKASEELIGFEVLDEGELYLEDSNNRVLDEASILIAGKDIILAQIALSDYDFTTDKRPRKIVNQTKIQTEEGSENITGLSQDFDKKGKKYGTGLLINEDLIDFSLGHGHVGMDIADIHNGNLVSKNSELAKIWVTGTGIKIRNGAKAENHGEIRAFGDAGKAVLVGKGDFKDVKGKLIASDTSHGVEINDRYAKISLEETQITVADGVGIKNDKGETSYTVDTGEITTPGNHPILKEEMGSGSIRLGEDSLQSVTLTVTGKGTAISSNQGLLFSYGNTIILEDDKATGINLVVNREMLEKDNQSQDAKYKEQFKLRNDKLLVNGTIKAEKNNKLLKASLLQTHDVTEVEIGSEAILVTDGIAFEQISKKESGQTIEDPAELTFVTEGAIKGDLIFNNKKTTFTAKNSTSSIEGDIAFNDGDNDATIKNGANIVGDVSFGKGAHQLTLSSQAKIEGAVTLGEGIDQQVSLSGNSEIDGKLTLHKGNITVNSSKIESIESTDAITVDLIETNFDDVGAINAAGNQSTLNLDSANHQLIGATALTGFNAINLNNGSIFNNDQALDLHGGTFTFEDADSKWNINQSSGDYNLDHKVSGLLGGTINVTLDSDQSFIINDSLAISDFQFSGLLQIDQGSIDLNSTGRYFTNEGKIFASGSGVLNYQIGQDDISINHIGLANGGTLALGWDDQNPLFDNPLHTDKLTVESGSKIQLDNINISSSAPPSADIESQFDEGNFQDQLNISDEAILITDELIGVESNITIVDQNGEEINSQNPMITSEIKQNGVAVGTAYYGEFGVAYKDGSQGEGVYLSQGVTRLDANSGDSVKISNKTSVNPDRGIGMQLTGSGGFDFDLESGTTLKVGNNSSIYSGDTTVKGGVVEFMSSHAFGDTSGLAITDGGVDLQHHIQTILGDTQLENGHIKIGEVTPNSATIGYLTLKGDLELDANSYIEIRDKGLLSLQGGATLNTNNALRGDGSLLISEELVTLSGDNTNYNGDTYLYGDGVVQLESIDALGEDNRIIFMDPSNQSGTDSSGKIILKELEGDFTHELVLNGEVEISTSGNGLTIIGDQSLFAGTVDLLDAKVTLKNDNGIGLGALKGTGELIIGESIDTQLIGDNSGFSGQLTLNEDSILQVNQEGFIDVVHIGERAAYEIILNSREEQAFTETNKLTGKGSFSQKGSGFLTVEVDQTQFEGNTLLGGGETKIASGVQYGAVGTLGEIKVNNHRLILEGDDHNSTTTLNASNVSVESGIVGGYGTINSNLTLDGNSRLFVGSRSKDGSEAYGTLTIDGNLTASAGSIIELGNTNTNSNSLADRLIVNQDATGESKLIVHSVNRIQENSEVDDRELELITVKGNNSLNLTLEGRATGDAFEYTLSDAIEENGEWHWYLQNEIVNGGGGNGGSTSAKYRPESGAYIANIAAANELFAHSVRDRTYDGHDSSVWTRISGSFEKFDDSTGENRISVDNYAMQVGVDFLNGQTASGYDYHIGGMFGYGRTESRSQNERGKRYKTEGTGDAYALGIYGTLGDYNRAYLDGWIQYVYMDAKIKGDHISQEKYKAKGMIASLEGGYAFQLQSNLYLQPQGQLSYHGVKSDEFTESDGTRIKGSNGNLQARVGLKLFGEYEQGEQILRPYGSLDYYHNSKPYYVEMGKTRIVQEGVKNMGSVGLGIQAELNKSATLNGEVSHRFGSSSYKDTRVEVGFKYRF